MNKKSATRRLRRQSQHRLKPVYAAVLLAFSVQTAQANPVGGSVVNGSASFATSGNTLTVTNTPGTIINWQGFSIGSNEATIFAQQSASSTVLNRVVGNDPSSILGTLRSNGRVFLINPNGILFGAGAVVDVAGLVASTLNLSNADFLAGNYHFTEVPGAANISNAGNITAQDHGQIYMIAPNVENTGVITAPNGEILLAAGASVDLVNTNDPDLRVNITAPAGNVTNVGKLIASSGSLGLFGTVVSNSGVVSADSATLQGGKIVFKASQLAEISGTVSATGVQGGDIQILGKQVAVVNNANVDASGINGGGTVLAGGDAHGANAAVQNAQQTFVSSDATIKADAMQRGDGGKVVVWADGATQFNGNISARGGSISGNGGWVEVSGKQWLGYAGLVNTTAANGMVGSLLLDPTDITIGIGLDSTSMIWNLGTLSFSDVTLTPSTLNVNTLVTQLASSNVTVDTSSLLTGTGNITIADSLAWNSANTLTLNAAGTGSISVNTNTSSMVAVIPLSINVAGGGSLVMQTAGGSILVGAAGGVNITGGGSFTANAGGTTSDVIFSSAINTGAGAINLTAGQSITEITGGSLTTTGLLTTNSVGGTTLNGANAVGSFAATNTGGGAIALTNTAANLTLSGISQTGAGAVTVTNTGNITSTGAINSDGNVTLNSTGLIAINNSIISALPINLVLNHGAAGNVTMAGTLDLTVGNLDIQNAGVSGTGTLNVTGGTITLTGALTAGTYAQSGGTWNQVIPTLPAFTVNDFSITGGTFIRALGGDGNIATPYQLADIYGVQGMGSAGMLGNSYVLANNIDASLTSGWNAGAGFAQLGNGATSFTGQFDGLGNTITGLTINRPLENYVGLFGSVSSGSSVSNVGLVNASVTGGTYYVGGLAGMNSGTITNSSSTNGHVTGGSGGYYVGGLAGINYGTIDNSSSASGWVNGTHDIGGLVGYNGGTISNSFASGNVTGNTAVGGLAGYNYGTISNSYVSSGYVYGYNLYVGGLVGQNTGVLTNSHYNINAVSINDSTVVTLGGLYDDYPSNGAVGQFSDWLTNGLTLNIANYASLSGIGNNYTISSVQGMKDLLGFADNAAYTFTLAGNINLVSNPGLYIPYLAAAFNGANFTVSNLNVSQSFNDNLGLFGNIATGSTVSNVVLTNANVTGNSNVGALAGWNQGTVSSSHVDNSNASGGSVSGVSNVGGLVGSNDGTISNSYIDNSNSLGGGNVSGTSNVGGLAGSNHGTISGSYVDSSNASGGSVSGTNSVGGLVGFNGSTSSSGVGGIINNSYVNNGKVTGSTDVGGLVGYGGASEMGSGGAISNSYFSGGTVNGSSYVGGLVGYISKGSISNSHVINATVIATSNEAGGLVGQNGGTISGSYVSGGSVSGVSNVGGLVGQNWGTVSGSYASGGTVSATGNDVGGLVGNNSGSVSGSYVDGVTVISAVSSGSGNGGGLVGYNSGTISNSYASNGSVSASGSALYMGGLVGQNAGTISNTYASGGTVSGNSSVGGLVGYNNAGSISNSYASTGVLSGGTVGGLVGNNAGTVSASFWDTTVATGVTFGIGNDAGFGGSDIGATGLTSAGMMTMANFTAAGWDIANTGGAGKVWRIYEGSTTPLLTSFLTPLTVTANNITKTYDGLAYSGGNGVTYSNVGAVLSGTVAYGGTSQGAVNVGSYVLSPTGLFSNQQGYDISYVNGALTITLLNVTITALVPTVITEIVDISNQKRKKPEDVLAVNIPTGNGGNTSTLPMCN